MEKFDLINLAIGGIAVILMICAFLMMYTTAFTTKK